ncbi:hypothetical protein, partial [Streptococcus pneumoniae]|uniref:hypothetical protein n=1 Tax=Streptococcus pneumoniae TaxID=1313 RepID=UPI00307DB6CA
QQSFSQFLFAFSKLIRCKQNNFVFQCLHLNDFLSILANPARLFPCQIRRLPQARGAFSAAVSLTIYLGA